MIMKEVKGSTWREIKICEAFGEWSWFLSPSLASLIFGLLFTCRSWIFQTKLQKVMKWWGSNLERVRVSVFLGSSCRGGWGEYFGVYMSVGVWILSGVLEDFHGWNDGVFKLQKWWFGEEDKVWGREEREMHDGERERGGRLCVVVEKWVECEVKFCVLDSHVCNHFHELYFIL